MKVTILCFILLAAILIATVSFFSIRRAKESTSRCSEAASCAVMQSLNRCSSESKDVNDPAPCGGNARSDSCTCDRICFSCGYYYPGPVNNDCGSYYECGSGNWTGLQCPEGDCFNTYTCTCMEECPKCGYIADPDDPTGFYDCSNGTYSPGKCGTPFDPEECTCSYETTSTELTTFTVPQTMATEELTVTEIDTTSTEAIPTSTEYDPCAYCGFYENPSNCSIYFECFDNGDIIVKTCPGTLCFDPEFCYCD